MSGAPDDPIAFVFINEVAIIEHLTRTAAERALPAGLSLAGFVVLNHMIRMRHERRAPAQIANAVQVTKGAMTGTVIDASLMQPEEKDILEDLIIAAHNDAKNKVEAMMAEEMKSVTGGLPLPPGLKLPF